MKKVEFGDNYCPGAHQDLWSRQLQLVGMLDSLVKDQYPLSLLQPIWRKQDMVAGWITSRIWFELQSEVSWFLDMTIIGCPADRAVWYLDNPLADSFFNWLEAQVHWPAWQVDLLQANRHLVDLKPGDHPINRLWSSTYPTHTFSANTNTVIIYLSGNYFLAISVDHQVVTVVNCVNKQLYCLSRMGSLCQIEKKITKWSSDGKVSVRKGTLLLSTVPSSLVS